MHRCVTTIALVLLAASLAGSAVPASAQEWADKMFDHREHDFASLARGADAQHRFRFENLYKEDVHVRSVSSSCGCTSPRVTKDLLKTGETADIVAEFNTRSFQGPHQATITVTFDRPYPAEVRLQVRGYIRKDVVFTPGKVELGTIDAGSTAEQLVDVAYAGRSDWEIVDVRSANTNFEVELKPKLNTGGRINYDLLVRLKPTAPPGYIHDRLTIVTNDAQNRYIPLAVEGNVVPSLTVSPTSLQMGFVKPGDKVTKQLVVRGKTPFKILRIECQNPAFQFQNSDQARKLHLIPVTYVAGDKKGQITEKIHIIPDTGSGLLPDVMVHVEVGGP